MFRKSTHWRQAENHDFPGILEFLKPIEYMSVSLSSRLNSSGNPQMPGKGETLLFFSTAGETKGVLYISKTGLALPLFFQESVRRHGLKELSRILKRRLRKIHTVIGPLESVRVLQHILGSKGISIDYFLMTLPLKEETGEHPFLSDTVRSPLIISRAGTGQAEMLFPLQEGYEKEEVLIHPESFQKERSLLLFKKALTEHIIFYGTLNGTAVTKAGTNALGFNWNQLGGIFTDPRYRGRGFGEQIVKHLCNESAIQNKGSCLFVKKDNNHAISMYRKVGFEMKGLYRISYYH